MRLFRSRFLRIAILPNLVFVLGLLLQAATSWRLTDSALYASTVFEETGAILTFTFIRKLLLAGYLIGAVYIIYQHFHSKKRYLPVLVRSLLIIGAGVLLSQFALFLALLTYDMISRIFI